MFIPNQAKALTSAINRSEIAKQSSVSYTLLLLLASILWFLIAIAARADDSNSECASWQQGSVELLHSSRAVDLCQLTKNKPLLVVNTASHCGYTRQFSGLERVHQKYQDQGLVVIGFPSNDFNQEDSSIERIADVCYKNFGVSFVMSDPVRVKGTEAHPVFDYLGTAKSAPNWNFNKYLIDRNGDVVHHFSSSTEPDSSEFNKAILSIL